MFRQQFMVDPPAEEDVLRILTFISTGLSLYFYKAVKNDFNLLLNPGIHQKCNLEYHIIFPLKITHRYNGPQLLC